MTIRPLPDIDLARIAPQPTDMKRKSLEQLRGGRPPFSYKPLRDCYDDIFNIQPDLDFGSIPATPWAVIDAELTRRCRSEVEFVHNHRVARGLHDFATSGRVMGRKQEFFPLSMGAGRKVFVDRLASWRRQEWSLARASSSSADQQLPATVEAPIPAPPHSWLIRLRHSLECRH